MACLALRSDRGLVREANEDACCALVAPTRFGEIVMAVVCDGVGGLSHGEVASSTVVKRFVQWFEADLPQLLRNMQSDLDRGLIQACWTELLDDLNKLIRQYGRSIGALLGTTFTGLLACGQSYVIGHVGDCRAYCLHGSALRQLTEDQTLLALMLARGEITPEEATTSYQRHVIMQSVGTQVKLQPAFYYGVMDYGDVMVLCSDGAYHSLGDEGLAKELKDASQRDERLLGNACEEILNKSMLAGESDNLTIVCVRCDNAGMDACEGKKKSLVSRGRDAL